MNDWMNEWVWTGVLKFGCVGTRSSTGRCSCFRCVGIAGEIGPPPLLARFSYPRVLFAPWDHPSTLRFPNSTPPLHQQQIHYVPNPTFWGFCLKQFFYLVTLMPKQVNLNPSTNYTPGALRMASLKWYTYLFLAWNGRAHLFLLLCLASNIFCRILSQSEAIHL